MNQNKIICVLGMHRSGTSVITRGIISLGADPGNRLIKQSEDNPKGYWEDLDINLLNEEILSDFSFSWASTDSLLVDRFNTLLHLYQEKYLDKAISIIENRFNRSHTIVIKDPRLNILLPFWKKVFSNFKTDVFFVLVIRNPLETAESILKRNSIPIEEGLNIWLYNYYQALNSLISNFIVISYSDFLNDNEKQLKRIADFISLSITEKDLKIFQNEFIDKTLWHNTSNINKLEEKTKDKKVILDIYKKLLEWTSDSFTDNNIAKEYLEGKYNYIRNILELPFENKLGDNFFRIYINEGEGFKELSFIEIKNSIKNEVIEFNLENYKTIQKLRLKLGSKPCLLELSKIFIVEDNKRMSFKSLEGNYRYNYNNKYFFDTINPFILLDINQRKISKIEFHLSIIKSNFFISSVISFFLKKDIEARMTKLKQRDLDFKLAVENHNKIKQLSDKLIKEKENLIETMIKEKENLIETKDKKLQEMQREIDTLQKIIKQNLEKLLYLEHYKLQKRFKRLAVFRCIKRFLGFFRHPEVSYNYFLEKRSIKKSRLFDEHYYLKNNPDLLLTCMDLLRHFILHGWKEGRNPNSEFDIKYYLNNYPDVMNSNMNPLYHYIKYGIKEGKKINLKDYKTNVIKNNITKPLEIDEKYYFDLSAESIPHTPIKTIAFYLPQFHCIPENDEWWGEGFTEWTNTRKTEPLFKGHHQPRTPTYLGYYNLDNIKVYEEQVNLAQKAGIYGFCFYFYWFNGKTLLEKPLHNIIANPQINQPFCLCWANENWTRRWDGQDNEILIAQNYSENDAIAFIKYINTYFADDRYIKLDGKPLLVIYRPELIPNINVIQQLWRDHVKMLGWPGIFLVSVQAFGHFNPKDFEFDAAVQFPPHHRPDKISINHKVSGLVRDFEGHISDYRLLPNHFCNKSNRNYKLFRGVMLNWENTARRGKQALIYNNFSLQTYMNWLLTAFKATLDDHNLLENEKIVFINAWNEWAEGTYLEPDNKYGFGYLESTKKALIASTDKKPRLTVIVPCFNHAGFIERRLNSIINQTIKPDEIIFLDDASPDDSVAIAHKILLKSNIKYTILKNKENSGNVFKQWIKGIEKATGDLIWIAESDDEASMDFLENILHMFDREDVLLAYGDISYIKPDNTPDNGLLNYYNGLNDLSWEHSHIVASYRAFTGAFAIKNIIPNVSGAVFRKPSLTEEEKKRLTSYTFAGDWYFYALIARGGSIAFCKAAKSFFRIHQQSTSRKAFFSDKHVKEHNMILQDLSKMYRIDEETIENHINTLWQVLKHQSPMISKDELTNSILINPLKPLSLRICIASLNFALGGGEAVPIQIANILRSLGHHVTFLVLKKNSPNDPPLLKPHLRSDIPIIFFEDIQHRFKDFLNEYGIEIFNSHNVGIEYAFYKANIKVNIPYIVSLHGGYEMVPELLSKKFIKYIKENVNEWFYLSTKNIEILKQNGLNDACFTKSFNIATLRPANIGSPLNIRKNLNATRETILFVLASRAIHEKGWQIAIDTIESLRKSTTRDCRLLLIGDGPDFKQIKDMNAHFAFVSFLGSIDNPIPIIKECDIGIFPSTFNGESFPLFIIECLGCGIPVFASDIGNISEIMTMIDGKIPGGVFTVKQGKTNMVKEMVQAISELISNEKNLISAKENAYKLAQNYTSEKIASLYLDVMYSHLSKKVEHRKLSENITQKQFNKEVNMIYRNPNTLYNTNHIVGTLNSAKTNEDVLIMSGNVNMQAIASFQLDQIIFLDLSGRYIKGFILPQTGNWSVEITQKDVGNDNSCLDINPFAASSMNNYIFPLEKSPAALTTYQNFIKPKLPESSKDVPSIKNDLYELIIKATQTSYVARSIFNAIPTGNNYQTLVLDNTLRKGGRISREKLLYRINFNGKTVLDIGANTGENSRIARKLGASLVDGYEYDPYFVEIGRAVNALSGMTRVSLFQGDCTRPELFKDMQYDIVLALAVWVYIQDTINEIAQITDILIFETHTLDHGIEFYYQPILKYFPHIISLGYTDKPEDPFKSRMLVAFGKEKADIDAIIDRQFLQVKPYFDNKFIRQYNNLSKEEILKLAKKCYDKHVNQSKYKKEDYVYATDIYFEVFMAGLHEFAVNEGKIEGLVETDNLYLRFLQEGIKKKQIDQNLNKLNNNPEWMIRKVSNKYEDAFNILNGHIDRVAPVEIVPDPTGKLIFTTTTGEEIKCKIFDGHHRFFMCELADVEQIHFVLNDGKTSIIPQRFVRNIASNYTLKV